MKELRFSLKLKELPVRITGADGQEKKYTLRELSGVQRDIFLDEMAGRMKYVGGKVEGLSNYKGLQAGLLALCLFDENDKPVEAASIQAYPASVLTALFAEAQSLSGLDVGGPDEAKNG